MNTMIFLNIAWMERYEGLIGNDTEISGGGSYVNKHGYGHEIYNFKKTDGKVYGYAQPGGANNLIRLGASEDAEYIKNILVIFTAAHKDGGTYIVGWYKDATFFKDYQNVKIKERVFRNEYIGYYATADADNATLLSLDERISFPQIPRRIKGGMGQSNVWYADGAEMVDFKKEVLSHIERYEIKKNIRNRHTAPRQVDIELRKKIESIAIREVIKEYSERGFNIASVESENVGWDLEATYKKTKLKIEVKGLSGTKVSIELTPNEFQNMSKYKDTYRLGVVTDCLETPILHVFSYSSERNEWLSEDGNTLVIDQIISARCYI